MAVSKVNKRVSVTMSKEFLHFVEFLASRKKQTLSRYIYETLYMRAKRLEGKPIMQDYKDYLWELENNIDF